MCADVHVHVPCASMYNNVDLYAFVHAPLFSVILHHLFLFYAVIFYAVIFYAVV